MKKILTLFVMALMVFSAKADGYVTNLENGIYQFPNTGDKRGTLAYDQEVTTMPVLAGITYANCQGNGPALGAAGVNLNWGVVKASKHVDSYYIYSVANNKFLSWTTNDSYAKYSDTPCPWKFYQKNIGGTNYTFLTTDRFVSAEGNGNYGLSFACGTMKTQGQLRAQTAAIGNSTDGGLKYVYEKQSGEFSIPTEVQKAIYDYENPPYAIGFANTTHTNSGRQITSIKLGDQEFSIDGAGNVYQDLTATICFTINVGEEVKPAIIWNGGWMDGYIYVDTDASDKQFTESERVSYANGHKTGSWVLANDFNTFSISTAGHYRMRYKVEWENNDPRGNSVLITNGGYILDVMLHVDAPEEVVSTIISYTAGSLTWTETKDVAKGRELDATDVAVDFYKNFQFNGANIVNEEGQTLYVSCEEDFPFTVGQPTRIRNTAHADRMDFYVDGSDVKYLTGTATAANNSNLWYFEHVSTTNPYLFTVKNLGTGKYLTFENGSRTAGTVQTEIKGSATDFSDQTSYVYIRKGNGGFCIQHPKYPQTCYSTHITESSKVGGWAAGDATSALNNADNALKVLVPEYFTANLAAASTEGNYGSIYLPYNMTLPADVEAYAAAKDGEVLKLTKVGEAGDVVPQGAYILYSVSKTSAALALGADTAVPAEGNALTGKFEANVDLPAGINYVLNKKNDVVGFYKYSKTTYPIAKAVFNVAEGSSNAFTFRFEDVITAIDALHSNSSDAEIYDLQGRRLNKAQKGMNIINGHKVLVK